MTAKHANETREGVSITEEEREWAERELGVFERAWS